MNAVEKFIRQSIAKAAATSKSLEISTLIAGSGVDRARVIEELESMIGDGSLQLDVDLNQVTALKFHQLTAHGHVVKQGNLFVRESPIEGAAPPANVEIGEPDLTVGGDTYHVAYSQDDQGWSVEIAENLGHTYKSHQLSVVVFSEIAIDTEAMAMQIANEWLDNRCSHGYHWAGHGAEYRTEISPFKEMQGGIEATLHYDLDVTDESTGHVIKTFSSESAIWTPEVAEELWLQWSAWRNEVVYGILDAIDDSPGWADAIFEADEEMLIAARNRLAFAAVNNGGTVTPMDIPGIDTEEFAFAVTRVERLPSNSDMIAWAELSAMKPDCESSTKARIGGVESGYSLTGFCAYLVAAFPEARGSLLAAFPHLCAPTAEPNDEPAIEPEPVAATAAEYDPFYDGSEPAPNVPEIAEGVPAEVEPNAAAPF